MRLSELGGKEIVDYRKAERLGILGQTDLEINSRTGEINHLIIPSGKWLGIRKGTDEIRVPWHFIRTIGSDMIILEVPDRNEENRY
ncbi:YlmC/YmxH family sporulation protein [Bacillus sp. FSL K6-3431]|uniref:YlmC/YmxH family sporulation protein n=1 Tax=Bacillus sp. FSL K6-3431 TaxID=2921500 RepID=UPI0030FD021E